MSQPTTYCRSASRSSRPALAPAGWHLASALGLASGSALALPSDDTLSARHEQARQAYARGEHAQAFAEYTALADMGHAESGRTAAWMSCFGSALYGLELPLAPERLARWQSRAATATVTTA